MAKKKSKVLKALYFLLALSFILSIVFNPSRGSNVYVIFSEIGSCLMAFLIIIALLKRSKKEKIVNIIDKDLEFNKKYLTGDYEKDKPLQWRIIGMEKLKEDIGKL